MTKAAPHKLTHDRTPLAVCLLLLFFCPQLSARDASAAPLKDYYTRVHEALVAVDALAVE